MTIGLQYDDAKLYVGAEIKDAAFAAGRDHVSLVLAVPTAERHLRDLRPRRSTRASPARARGAFATAGAATSPARRSSRPPRPAATRFEAIVPWSALPEARVDARRHPRRRALRRGRRTRSRPGPVNLQHPAAMAWIPSEPELSMIEQFLAPKGLTKAAPTFDAVADLTGDGVRERIAVFEHYLTICGSSYLGGHRLLLPRPRRRAREARRARRDGPRQGRRRRAAPRRASAARTREYLEVLSAMSNTDEPRVTFAHEIEVRQADKHIDNAVRLSRGEIEVSVEPPTNWDALSYQEPIASDVEPILFPWGGVRSQTWRWDGSHFTKAKEVDPEGAAPAAAATVRPSALAHPAEPPTPEGRQGRRASRSRCSISTGEDRGVAGDAAPKSDLRVQVTGDARPERVVLVGRDIVVFGPGFKGGTGYSFVTLAQFADAADVTEMSARDLTGDGNADLIVRGVRHVSADGGSVDSEVLFVYQVTGRRDHAHLRHRDRARAREQARAGARAVHPRAGQQDVRRPRRARARHGLDREDLPVGARPARRSRHRAAPPALGRHGQRSLPLERLPVRQARRLNQRSRPSEEERESRQAKPPGEERGSQEGRKDARAEDSRSAVRGEPLAAQQAPWVDDGRAVIAYQARSVHVQPAFIAYQARSVHYQPAFIAYQAPSVRLRTRVHRVPGAVGPLRTPVHRPPGMLAGRQARRH